MGGRQHPSLVEPHQGLHNPGTELLAGTRHYLLHGRGPGSAWSVRPVAGHSVKAIGDSNDGRSFGERGVLEVARGPDNPAG